MKKILIKIFIILLWFSTFLWFLSAEDDKYILKDNDLKAINKVWEIYLKKFDNYWEKYKQSLIDWFDEIIPSLWKWSKNYEIIYALNNFFKTGEYYKLEEDKKTEEIEKPEEKNETEKNNNDEKSEEIKESDKIVVWGDTKDEYNSVLKVDFAKVKQAWIGWQNEVRWELWLSNYHYDNWKLQDTAQEWAEVLMSRSDNTDFNNVHKRDLSDSYYDYNKIANWFKDRWVVCKNVDRYTFSESVGWTSYYCPAESQDCTYEFIEWLRKSFDRYMEERDRTENSRPHYNAIVSKNFKRLWMWLAVQEKWKNSYEVYIATHYCTELVD